MIGLELEESLGIFYNVPLRSRLQQVPDLLGFFQQISFFPVSGTVCVSTVHLGRVSGMLQGDGAAARPCSRLILQGIPRSPPRLQLQVGAGGEWGDQEMGKSPDFE